MNHQVYKYTNIVSILCFSAAPERRTVEFEAKTNFKPQSHISSMLVYKDFLNLKYTGIRRF